MQNVLSQDEIDSLINALSSGEIDAEQIEENASHKKAKDYDFRRPNKLSKEQIQTLKGIHENYARIVSNILSNQVRNNVKFTVASLEQVTFGEFIRSIPNPTVLGYYSCKPLEGVCVLELNPNFCFNMIDLYFGGMISTSFDIREFTDIEMMITKQILNDMIDNFKNVWGDIIELSPELEGIETNPLLQQALPHNETVVLVTFKAQILEENTLVNLCIPYRTLEVISDKLNIKNYDTVKSSGDNETYREALESLLQKVELEVEVLLGKAKINVSEFIGLNVGDILELDTKVNGPMKILVADKEKLYVQPGLYHGKLAVQVIEDIGKDAGGV